MNSIGLFVGQTTIDIQYLVENFLKSNTKTKAKQYGISTGGPAANAAITFSYLGGESHLWSVIGNHFFTDFICEELEHYNVKVSDLLPDSKNYPVIASIISTESSGDRSIVYTISDDAPIPPEFLREINTYRFNIVLVDGLNMKASITVAKYAKNNNIPVVLDGGSWKDGMESLLPYVTFAICAEDFYPPDIHYNKSVLDYLSLKNIEYSAITRGGNSIIYKTNKNYGEIIVDSLNVIDTLGAGDIFHGAFCYYYIKSNNFVSALTNASRTASMSCQFFGTRSWMNKL